MDVDLLTFEEAPFKNPTKSCGCSYGELIWIWGDCEHKIEDVINHETVQAVLCKRISIEAHNTFDNIVKKIKELPR